MKLEDDKLWRTATEIADYTYSILAEFPEEEKWTTVAKLRNCSFDLNSSVAEAAGTPDPRDKSHFYGNALRAIYGMKNALIMAHKSGSLTLNPDVMVKLDKLAEQIEEQITLSDKAIPKFLMKYDSKEGAK